MPAATTSHHHYQPDFEPHMSGALIVSLIFHAIILILCITGLPYIKRDLPAMEEPMVVELAKRDEISQTDKKPIQQEELPKKPPQQLSDTPPTPPELPPKVEDKTPPKPAEPAAPEKPDELAPPPKEKPKEKPAPVAKPAAPKKKPDPKKEDTAKKQEDFKSLLKNLTPEETKAAQPVKAPDTGAEPSPLAKFAQQMTMSESDALRHQLSQCWNLMAGAKFAEDLVVDIRLIVNPDRTIQDAQIVDQLRYMNDSYFRAAADAAVRAVRNPRCNPLDLPPEKYELWKTMTVTFDPRQML